MLTKRERIGSDSMPPTTVEILTSEGYIGKEHTVIQFPGATKVPLQVRRYNLGKELSTAAMEKRNHMTSVKTSLLCQPLSSCFSVSNPTEAYFEYCLANAYRKYAARETKQPSVISFGKQKQFNLKNISRYCKHKGISTHLCIVLILYELLHVKPGY